MLRPKVVGGWLLHRLTADCALDFFVCYASGAGTWGGKQQAHYGAANHFLDGLMAYRRSLGLPGLSIAWGPWAGGGMAGAAARELLEMVGVRAFTPEQGLEIQAHLLQTTASQVTAADIDWSRLKALYELTKPRRFLAKITVAQAAAGQHAAETPAAGVQRTLQSLPPDQRLGYLRRHIQQTLARILGMAGTPAQMPDSTTGFADLGIDSLMALELRRTLEQDLRCTLPATIAFEYPTAAELATYLLEELFTLTDPVHTTARPHVARGHGSG